MKKILPLSFLIFSTLLMADSNNVPRCKKGLINYKCHEGAQRESICSKHKNLSKKTITKRCNRKISKK